MIQPNIHHSTISMKTMRNRRGFTLLELMIVIVVGATLLAIAIPNFEALVYGPASNRATIELIGALNEARLKAIKMHQQVRVTFNQPVANQLRVRWFENGVQRDKVHRLSSNPARITFDNAPPGGVFAPDNNFVFDSMGFIQPDLGNATGNIYVVDNTNGRRFNITTTLAGGIIERRWDGGAWTGPEISYEP